MHGLVFVTWEKYLAERFGGTMLDRYRQEIGETAATSPLVSHVYDDALLLVGVSAATRVTGIPTEQLLHEYGRYFITNSLTRHLCSYLLNQLHNPRDLLLAMRDAHEQMSHLPGGLTPPLFGYEIPNDDPNGLILIYDSKRHFCTLLRGAIEGAASRYGEEVTIVERACMKRGDAVCRFEIHFPAPDSAPKQTEEQTRRQTFQQQFAQYVLSLLPKEDGITLMELQEFLWSRGVSKSLARPALVLEALNHLHHAGLVATSATEPGDSLMSRRYWRIPSRRGA